MTLKDAIHFVMHNRQVHLMSEDAAVAVTTVAKAASVLPKIIEYLAEYPMHQITLTHGGGQCWMALVFPGNIQADVIALSDDPGAVVLAALANWRQANEYRK